MTGMCAKLQAVLYPVFLVACGAGSLLALLFVWEVLAPSKLLARVLATAAVIAVASALTMSATRLVSGPPPEDDGRS
jgi:hypothetical protein